MPNSPMAQKGLGVALGSLLAREVDLIATHATPRGLELEKLESEGTGEVQLPSSTWSASMQLREFRSTRGRRNSSISSCFTKGSAPMMSSSLRPFQFRANVPYTLRITLTGSNVAPGSLIAEVLWDGTYDGFHTAVRLWGREWLRY